MAVSKGRSLVLPCALHLLMLHVATSEPSLMDLFPNEMSWREQLRSLTQLLLVPFYQMLLSAWFAASVHGGTFREEIKRAEMARP